MRKIGFPFSLLIILLLTVFCLPGAAEDMSVDPLSEVIRPGRAVQITFTVPESGRTDLILREQEEDGTVLSVVVDDLDAEAGRNGVWWNGTYNGYPAPEGEGVLVLIQGERSVETPVVIGPAIPMILGISSEEDTLEMGGSIAFQVNVSCAGLLTLTGSSGTDAFTLLETEVEAGSQTVVWNGENAKDGIWKLHALLKDSEGLSAEGEGPEITCFGFDEVIWEDDSAGLMDQRQFTPSYTSPYTADDPEGCYWSTPMDITDEEAVWKMLTAPVTVVNNGKKNAEKTQVVIRAEPNEDAGGVGVVTCMTQSVHVLEMLDNGWTLIETYSSSFHDSRIKAWNMLVQGYVPTDMLMTVEPNQEIGLVVDKLTQRLYIFTEGRLFSTLLVSTGLANARQPYNETRSGEFLCQVPAVGEFRSDNLYCSMGIRFNSGDLLHEVPHMKNADGTKNYSTTEGKLGTRGSHGCIRVQRRKTPEGTNMLWIWNNKKNNMKIVIWEDWQGRQYPYPSDDMLLYYNPKSGKYYHTQETCYSARTVTFSPFTYGELDTEAYAGLERCTYCAAPLRRAEIDEINALHAPGGDHDPVLTEARQKQPLIQ